MLFPLQLPGVLTLGTQFVPTIMNLLRKLAEEGVTATANEPGRNPTVAPHGLNNTINASSEISSSDSSEVIDTAYSSSSKED